VLSSRLDRLDSIDGRRCNFGGSGAILDGGLDGSARCDELREREGDSCIDEGRDGDSCVDRESEFDDGYIGDPRSRLCRGFATSIADGLLESDSCFRDCDEDNEAIDCLDSCG
jgi:hypothetical protein